MLQAVHVIHEEKIVHSDLKPANFVLVKGQLKLIDFGIANAIANDTTNIQRDHQIGTVNYMSPEAIELQGGMQRLKVGRPSDVWSLGLSIIEMSIGRYPYPPETYANVFAQLQAIVNGPPPELNDGYSEKAQDFVRRCLVKEPTARATYAELLVSGVVFFFCIRIQLHPK